MGMVIPFIVVALCESDNHAGARRGCGRWRLRDRARIKWPALPANPHSTPAGNSGAVSKSLG
jgi:hypothetical protein